MNRSRILVVGDAMLDRYWDGVVDRISPEAPVPVLRVTRRFDRPTGRAGGRAVQPTWRPTWRRWARR